MHTAAVTSQKIVLAGRQFKTDGDGVLVARSQTKESGTAASTVQAQLFPYIMPRPLVRGL